MPFERGKSGNPGGRPKQDPDITALAKKESPKAFQQIIKISQDTAVDSPQGMLLYPGSGLRKACALRDFC